MRKPKRHKKRGHAVLTSEPNRLKGAAIQSPTALVVPQSRLPNDAQVSAAQAGQKHFATDSAKALPPIAAAAENATNQIQLKEKRRFITALLAVASYLGRLSLAWLRANFFTWLFRIFTLISVGYLVYDRFYETGALIQSPASDPLNPFLFPFSITNMSHIFTLRNIKWRCEFPFRTYDRLLPWSGSPANIYQDIGMVSGTKDELSPGGVLNISCGHPLGNTDFFPFQSIKVLIYMDYDTNVPWPYPIHRSPHEQFTWIGTAEKPQWIRGQLPEHSSSDWPF
jgi:hypothetical protein